MRVVEGLRERRWGLVQNWEWRKMRPAEGGGRRVRDWETGVVWELVMVVVERWDLGRL